MLALLRNPWVLLGALVVLMATFAGGLKVGGDYAKGQAAREEVLIAKAGEKASQAAAAAISKIKVVNQTNRTRIEREIVKVPDLSTCRAGDGVRGVLDDALTGKARPDAAPGGGVPSPEPAR
jgi:hypothetical protein